MTESTGAQLVAWKELAAMPVSAGGLPYRLWLVGQMFATGASKSGNTKQAARIAVDCVDAALDVLAEERVKEAGGGTT